MVVKVDLCKELVTIPTGYNRDGAARIVQRESGRIRQTIQSSVPWFVPYLGSGTTGL